MAKYKLVFTSAFSCNTQIILGTYFSITQKSKKKIKIMAHTHLGPRLLKLMGIIRREGKDILGHMWKSR